VISKREVPSTSVPEPWGVNVSREPACRSGREVSQIMHSKAEGRAGRRDPEPRSHLAHRLKLHFALSSGAPKSAATFFVQGRPADGTTRLGLPPTSYRLYHG
jgi:hypothetical protein